MKKSLVLTLALVFVLGIAGSAFAANPFTDVPANHWAYASISKLAQAGIIDGYGDGRYVGNNTMNRYEMAQIVAKAMAKVDSADAAQKSQIEKLAAEFAYELDSLGVRVAKLEKNADNVKITGEARFANYNYSDFLANNDATRLRTRIWLRGQVNDRWSYTGMFENHQDLKTNSREGTVALRRAWLEGSIGVINVTAGSFNYAPMYGTVLDNDMDGIVLNYSSRKFNIDLFAGRPDGDNPFFTNGRLQNFAMYGTQMNYAFSDDFNAKFAYYKMDGSLTSDYDANIFELGLDYRFNKDLMVWAEYLRGDKPESPLLNGFKTNGWAAGVKFGQVDRQRAGSWQLWASYYNVPQMASVVPTTELSFNFARYGAKGWTVGGTYMAAKNIDANIEYYDYKSQRYAAGNRDEAKLLWTYVRFYF